MDFLKRTWAEIDLSALDNNISEIRRLCPDKEIMAVVKANAYGHDDKTICSELKRLGIKYYAVSNLWEAEDLRRIVQDGEIVIFGYTEGSEFLKSVIENNFIHTVGSTEYAKRLNEFALSAGGKIRSHIKINTGMTRVGIDTEKELEEILSLSGLKCEGIFTHFAVSDSGSESDARYTKLQHKKLLDIAKKHSLLIHSQNSGGILYHGDFKSDIIRAGVIMYGYMPNTSLPSPMKLNPVMTLKSAICQLKKVKKGTDISYGRAYTAPCDMLTAVLPVGYADGYSRALSNRGYVSVNGVLCPVLGRVCMDQIVIDVSDVPDVKVGCITEVFSAAHKETSIEYIADTLETITYEITCGVGHRVPRVAVRDGVAVDVVRYE